MNLLDKAKIEFLERAEAGQVNQLKSVFDEVCEDIGSEGFDEAFVIEAVTQAIKDTREMLDLVNTKKKALEAVNA